MYERIYKPKVLNAQRAPEEEKRRSRRFRWKYFLWSGGGVLLLVGFVLLARASSLQVRDIRVEGTTVVDPEEVVTLVQDEMNGRFLFFLPRTSMLVLSTRTITHRIEQAFPRFSSVSVRRSGTASLEVVVTEREGTYLWCRGEDDCFFMTNEGVVFAVAPFFSGDAYERIFYGNEVPLLPFTPLPTSFLGVIETLRTRLPILGIIPTEYRFVSEHELVVVFSHHGTRAELRLNHTTDSESMLEDLATGLGTEPLKGLFRDEEKTLEYLDVRFSNKVVYKFR